MRMYVDFRGEERLVHVKDCGYDHDANSHDIDWWFDDEETDKDKSVTSEELEAIDQTIRIRLLSYQEGDD